MSITVELWGGPKDGCEMTVDSLHLTLNFPVPPENPRMTKESSNTNTPDFRVVRVGIYTARTGPDRCNGKGLPVFEWRGIR